MTSTRKDVALGWDFDVVCRFDILDACQSTSTCQNIKEELAKPYTEALARTMALACLGRKHASSGFGVSEPPPIRSDGDIPRFQAWVEQQSTRLQFAMASQVFRGMPQPVVTNTKVGSVGIDSVRGQQGVLYYQLQQELQTLMRSWQLAQSQFAQLANHIALLESNLQLARIRGERALVANEMSGLALENSELGTEASLLELDRQQAQAELAQLKKNFRTILSTVGGGAVGFAKGGPYGAAVGAAGPMVDYAGEWAMGAVIGTEEEIEEEYRDKHRDNLNQQRANILGQMGLNECQFAD